MFDPYNPNDLYQARQYEDELFAHAKAHPHVGKGMSVEVCDGNLHVYCEGRVTDMQWYKPYNMYVCEVLVDGHKYYIFDSCLRPSRGPIRETPNRHERLV